VLTHLFNSKKASMAAALCYGVRGGGAQLAFHASTSRCPPVAGCCTSAASGFASKRPA
jgi:hypothetical protein